MTKQEIETIDALADEIYARLDSLMGYIAQIEATNKKKSPKKTKSKK
jgi:hypothetical protein